MKKLNIGFKDRSSKEVEVDDGVYVSVKPMSQEIMTGMAMYTNGMRDRMMSSGEKKEFIGSHITGWRGIYDEDGEVVSFTPKLAIDYLTHDDYDDLFMLLYWKSVELAGIREEEVSKDKEQAKK